MEKRKALEGAYRHLYQKLRMMIQALLQKIVKNISFILIHQRSLQANTSRVQTLVRRN